MQILNDKFGLSYLSGNAQILFANTGTVQQFNTILANTFTNQGNTFTINAAGVYGANLITTANVSGANIIISGNLFLGGTSGSTGQYIRKSATGIAWVDTSFNGGTITDSVVISNTTVSTSVTTGALTTTGGIGVAGAAIIGGNIVAASGVASTSTTTGALVVTGGVGVAGNLNVGSSTSGYKATFASPGAGTSGVIFIGASLNSSGNGLVISSATRTTADNAVPMLHLIARDGTIALSTTVQGNTVIGSTTSAASIATGALVVKGGVGIAENLQVGGVVTGRFNNIHTNQNANVYINVGTTVTLQTGTRITSSAPNVIVSLSGNITTTANVTANTLVYGAAVIEPVAIHAGTAPSGEMNINLLANSTHYYTPAATGLWTPNVRAGASTPLNDMLTVGQQISFSMIINQGATPRNNNSGNLRIDNVWFTAKWPNATLPTAVATRTEIYSYTLIKTGAATWIALGSSSSLTA